ncbi:hypothetical protein BC830DRAFT_1163228 [Chytriomyces sp. MP71]|nr:hypothetical protein BC830DRAFT_1163228 [Chytriomyces sp. MP71]
MGALTLRLRRLRATYFVSCESGDTVLALKTKLAHMVGKPREAKDLRILVQAKAEQGKQPQFNALEDPALLEQLGLVDDALLHFVLALDGQPEGSWEPVQIIEFDPLNEDPEDDPKGKAVA